MLRHVEAMFGDFVGLLNENGIANLIGKEVEDYANKKFQAKFVLSVSIFKNKLRKVVHIAGTSPKDNMQGLLFSFHRTRNVPEFYVCHFADISQPRLLSQNIDYTF